MSEPETGTSVVTTAVRALRLAAAAGASLAVVGVIDRYGQWPLLTATLGPTAYMFAAHPDSITSRRRNAVIGHGVALAVGLAALAVFGLWHAPSAALTGHVSLAQAFATAAALCVTLVILEVADTHHAPAAATAVLVTTGLARPGRPLVGLVLGLVVLLILSPVLSWAPTRRHGDF